MGHIIPVINAVSFAEVKEKIKRLEPYAEGPDNGGIKWVHIDVADGSFTENILWHDPKELLEIKTPLFLELHLMLDYIDEKITDWLLPNVRRNIVHVEAAQNLGKVIQLCHQADIEAGVALKPETPCSRVAPDLGEADLVQVLAVRPGPSGQMFQETMIAKIEELRRMFPGAIIEVDGGVNADVVRRASAAGATLFAAGHVLFAGPDIGKAIEELERNA